MSSETLIFYAQLRQLTDVFIESVPLSEQLRAQKFRHAQRQQLYLLGRGLLGQALERSGQKTTYQLDYLDSGKPVLASHPDWHFNLTHSGEHLFLALRHHAALGIDSEQVLPRDYRRLAHKMFAPEVKHAIQTSNNPAQTFYRFWTQHEAQVKFHGVSVYRALPQALRYINSYTFDSLVLSVCSERAFTSVTFYRYKPAAPDTFEAFHPQPLQC